MYSNIGAKIKVLAQVIAWVGIIGSVIAGFALIAEGSGARTGGESLEGAGIAVLVVGPIISWIASWFMYGFGVLIEKTTEIANNTAKGITSVSLTTKMENAEKLKTLLKWKEQNLITEEEFETKKQAFLREE